jgi:hypothetical protein
MSGFKIDGKEVAVRIIKYLLEGAAVATAAVLIPKKSLSMEEVLTIALVAASIFSILDLVSPSIGASVRSGVGLSIGSGVGGGFHLAK